MADGQTTPAPAAHLAATKAQADRECAAQLAAGCLFPSTELQFRATHDRTVDVVAEHCLGGPYGDEPFTRLTSRKLWIDGGRFLVNVDGWLADGSLHTAHGHRFTYRLNLRSSASAQAKAA
jgi:hypothetical protein